MNVKIFNIYHVINQNDALLKNRLQNGERCCRRREEGV